MATKQSTIQYLLDQLPADGSFRTQKMFGEYALYLHEKVVAFVCDDQLFLKPTIAGKNFLEVVEEAPAYPGSKMYYRIDADSWEDREFLLDLFTKTASELPLPKPKKTKK